MARSNAVVAQSGGPSPVINASLQGVIEACLERPEKFGNLYGAWHGVEGILKEELIDLRSQDIEEIRLLRSTPSAGVIGTCRYKLKEGQDEDFDRIIEVFNAHDIRYFFYIGGNDSMDTAQKVSDLAARKGVELTAVGIPKTIDNDLGDEEFQILDHTPGYGSAARYWSYLIQNLAEENRAMSGSEPVCVIQTMGRKSGFIPAAARLSDHERNIPMLLLLAETQHSLESVADAVNDQLKSNGSCLIVVSEGFDIGNLGEEYDDFGHIEYSSSRTSVAQQLVNYLNENRLRTRGLATGQVPGALQRCVSLHASRVDIDEAYRVGQKAVDIALEDGSGWMATMVRKSTNPYRIVYDKVSLRTIANTERHLPRSWISSSGFDVTDDFLRYALPLIGGQNPEVSISEGFQRFARFRMNFVERKTRAYQPMRDRETGEPPA